MRVLPSAPASSLGAAAPLTARRHRDRACQHRWHRCQAHLLACSPRGLDRMLPAAAGGTVSLMAPRRHTRAMPAHTPLRGRACAALLGFLGHDRRRRCRKWRHARAANTARITKQVQQQARPTSKPGRPLCWAAEAQPSDPCAGCPPTPPRINLGAPLIAWLCDAQRRSQGVQRSISMDAAVAASRDAAGRTAILEQGLLQQADLEAAADAWCAWGGGGHSHAAAFSSLEFAGGTLHHRPSGELSKHLTAASRPANVVPPRLSVTAGEAAGMRSTCCSCCACCATCALAAQPLPASCWPTGCTPQQHCWRQSWPTAASLRSRRPPWQGLLRRRVRARLRSSCCWSRCSCWPTCPQPVPRRPTRCGRPAGPANGRS